MKLKRNCYYNWKKNIKDIKTFWVFFVSNLQSTTVSNHQPNCALQNTNKTIKFHSKIIFYFLLLFPSSVSIIMYGSRHVLIEQFLMRFFIHLFKKKVNCYLASSHSRLYHWLNKTSIERGSVTIIKKEYPWVNSLLL